MSDLIDRNMAITHVNAVLFPKINTAKEAEKALRELPTVDAVEVLRCKDCKYHYYEEHRDYTIPYCGMIDYGYGWKDDDFCSRGERRTDV